MMRRTVQAYADETPKRTEGLRYTEEELNRRFDIGLEEVCAGRGVVKSLDELKAIEARIASGAMNNIIFSPKEWADYCHWQKKERIKILSRITRILEDIQRYGPMEGIRKPEAGSVRKKTVTRNGKTYTYWEGRVTTDRHPGTGKRIQKSFSGKTQKEVPDKMRVAAQAVSDGTYKEPSKVTVAEWLDIWEKEYLPGAKDNGKENIM